jgi:hypothetical protein
MYIIVNIHTGIVLAHRATLDAAVAARRLYAARFDASAISIRRAGSRAGDTEYDQSGPLDSREAFAVRR